MWLTLNNVAPSKYAVQWNLVKANARRAYNFEYALFLEDYGKAERGNLEWDGQGRDSIDGDAKTIPRDPGYPLNPTLRNWAALKAKYFGKGASGEGGESGNNGDAVLNVRHDYGNTLRNMNAADANAPAFLAAYDFILANYMRGICEGTKAFGKYESAEASWELDNRELWSRSSKGVRGDAEYDGGADYADEFGANSPYDQWPAKEAARATYMSNVKQIKMSEVRAAVGDDVQLGDLITITEPVSGKKLKTAKPRMLSFEVPSLVDEDSSVVTRFAASRGGSDEDQQLAQLQIWARAIDPGLVEG
jgi:hypothetical protein